MTAEPDNNDPASANMALADPALAESARAPMPKYQPLLAGAVVAAIILMIAFGAIWTSF